MNTRTIVTETATRDQLIDYCVWNDPNGCYTDSATLLEFGQVADTEALRAIVAQWLEEA